LSALRYVFEQLAIEDSRKMESHSVDQCQNTGERNANESQSAV